MTITQTTQSTGSRAARRIALAGGAAAIAAVALSGVASAAPQIVVNKTHTFGSSSTTTQVIKFTPSTNDPQLGFAASRITTVGTRGAGGTIAVIVDTKHPLKSTIGVGVLGSAGGHSTSVTLGIQNGHIIPPVNHT